jgi:hypothetical protein
MTTVSCNIAPERRSDEAAGNPSRQAAILSDAEGATPKTALVFLIFLAAGPPLGGLALWTIAVVLGRIPAALSMHDLSLHLQALSVVALASYIFGGVQAQFVACVAAIVQSMSRVGLVPFLPILLAALLAGGANAAFLVMRNERQPLWDLVPLIGLHVGSGLLCWLICNAVLWPFRRRSANQVMA